MTESQLPPSREFPQRPIVGVGVVVRRGDELLLVERGHEPLAGMWSVPGGAVELGETTRAAAAREVEEETGIAVEIGRLLTVVDRVQRDLAGRLHYHYVLVEFEARPRDAGAEPRAATDARQARWVHWEDLANYALVPKLEEVLALVRG
ncbi:MAG: NUDIX hydrolase [Terriglobales bacterium]